MAGAAAPPPRAEGQSSPTAVATAREPHFYFRHGAVVDNVLDGVSAPSAAVRLLAVDRDQTIGIVAGSVSGVVLLAGVLVLASLWKRRRGSRIVDISAAKTKNDESGNLRSAAKTHDSDVPQKPTCTKAMVRVLRFMGRDGGNDDNDSDNESPGRGPHMRALDSVHVTKRRLSQKEQKEQAWLNKMPMVRAKDSIDVTKRRISQKEEKENKEIEELSNSRLLVRAKDSVHVRKLRLSKVQQAEDDEEDEDDEEPIKTEPFAIGGNKAGFNNMVTKDSIFVAQKREAKQDVSSPKQRKIKDSILVKQHREKLTNRQVRLNSMHSLATGGTVIEEEGENEDEHDITEEELQEIAAIRLQAASRRLGAKKVVAQRRAAVERGANR